jgi:hypothetical protein
MSRQDNPNFNRSRVGLRVDPRAGSSMTRCWSMGDFMGAIGSGCFGRRDRIEGD